MYGSKPPAYIFPCIWLVRSHLTRNIYIEPHGIEQVLIYAAITGIYLKLKNALYSSLNLYSNMFSIPF